LFIRCFFWRNVCTELSKIISPQKTFLISTCKSRNELPWFIKTLKHFPIHKMVSEKQHRKMAYQGRWIIGFGKAYIPEFLGMVNSMTENYFKYCINIIASWNRKELPQNDVFIFMETRINYCGIDHITVNPSDDN
jgi:hypothetical protein